MILPVSVPNWLIVRDSKPASSNRFICLKLHLVRYEAFLQIPSGELSWDVPDWKSYSEKLT